MNVIIPLKAITFIIIGSKFVISSDTSDLSVITVNDAGSTTGLTGASPISVVDPAASSGSPASTTEFTLASLVISDPATPAQQSSPANSQELDTITVLDNGVGTGHHTYVGGEDIIKEDSSKPAENAETEKIVMFTGGFPSGWHHSVLVDDSKQTQDQSNTSESQPSTPSEPAQPTKEADHQQATTSDLDYYVSFPTGWHSSVLVEDPKQKVTHSAPVAEQTANQADFDDILIIDHGFPNGHHIYVGGEDIIKEETAPSSEPAKSMVIENADGTIIAQGPSDVIQTLAPEAKPIAAEAPKVTEIAEPTKTHVARPIVPEKTEESKTKLDEKKADDAEKKKEKEEDKEKKDKKEEKKLGKTKKTKDAKGKPLKTGFHIPVYGVAVMVASGFVLVVSVAVVATAKK